MSDLMKVFSARVGLALVLACFCVGLEAVAEDSSWRVAKSSGEVWVATSGVQPVSLTDRAVLNPGDNIRTGRNGRVLLVRGDETILVAPNSVIDVPAAQKGGRTSIIQRAGSALFNVEKRNVEHFEVETPYLAAVVKGTEFRVSVNATGSTVDVIGGSVEVADHRSGQYALVLPGQAARVSSRGQGGLSLSGPGALGPIQQGTPRANSVAPVPVPARGLTAPRDAAHTDKAAPRDTASTNNANSGLRIGSAIGDVKLDFQQVTKGLARAEIAHVSARSHMAARTEHATVWSTGGLVPAGNANGLGNGNGGNGNGPGNGLANASANAAAIAAQTKGKGKHH
ncbi:FecR family protein [Bradyrhizobium sp.]|uniref:FecR family protein n=1 Tax=Bradyrhizobium sp. TaxID=376 RepID=UPI0025C021B6|nr:FecR family protein [Bradyrhizobium sp.]